MARGEHAGKRSRPVGKAFYDRMGMPKPRIEEHSPALPLPRQSTPRNATYRNPRIEVQLFSRRLVLDRYDLLSRSVTRLGATLVAQNLQNPFLQPPRLEAELVVTRSANIRLNRNGKDLEWVKVLQVFKGVPAEKKKTFGFIREKGQDIPLISASSGWLPTMNSTRELLDNALWTQAVREFSDMMGHKLSKRGYDGQHEGQYLACHVEKKLMLFFVCHYVCDSTTGIIDERRVESIRHRQTPLEAVITMDKCPCSDCLEFKRKVEDLTGIRFYFEQSPETARTRTERENGKLVRRFCREDSLASNIDSRRRTKRRISKNQTKKIKTHSSAMLRKDARREAQRPVHQTNKDVAFPRNPRIMVLLPSRIVSKNATKAQGQHVQARPHQTVRPPQTPVRPTRSNGLFTPPPSPFSFDILDMVDRRRRKGTASNPYLIC